MPKRAKAFWLAIVLGGACLWALSLRNWAPDSQQVTKLFIYAFAAVLTSGLKVWLPGISSTISMSYFVFIAGLLDLDLPAAVLVGAAGVLGQTFYKHRETVKWHQLFFNVSNISLSIAAAGYCYRLHLFPSLDPLRVFSAVCMSASYFAVSTLILAAIIAMTTERKTFAVWRESYLWTSPQYLVGGLIAIGFHLMLYRLGLAGVLSTLPVMYLVYRSYKLHLSQVEAQQNHLSEMAQLHLRTIEALALAIDAKDDTTAAHLRRVQIYASEIGKELGLSNLEMQALEAAALLHDIGKLAVPEYIISKPGKLTPDEFEKMKIHPIVGAEILERVDFPYPVVPIVRAHHEKYDGTGYPDGLRGEEIPIGARILSVVDCLDAMASDRQYRKAMPLDDAMDIVAQQSGRSYDPRIIEIMQRRYRELEAKAKGETVGTAGVSCHIKVERGESPATGFASEAVAVSAKAEFHVNVRGRSSDARRNLQTLIEFAGDHCQALGNSLSPRETLALLAVRLEESIPHDALAIYIRQEQSLIPRYVKGKSSRLFSSLNIPVGQGLSGWVAENDLPIVNGNPAVESGYLNDPTKVTPLRSAIAVPLRTRDRVVGVLTLYQLQADAFTLDDKRILLGISENAGNLIEKTLRSEQLHCETLIDELTGLANSRALLEELDRRMTSNEVSPAAVNSMAVVVMDLYDFKTMNDEYGRRMGDRILQYVAAGVKKFCRADDLLARWGAGRFVLVLREPGDDVDTLVDRISEAGVAAAAEAGGAISLSIYAGHAAYPRDGRDAESLLEKAEERMAEKRHLKRTPAAPAANVVAFPKAVQPESAAPWFKPKAVAQGH